MPSIIAPYIPQAFDGACGIAAFEMALRCVRPSRLTKFNGLRTFGDKARPDPHGGHAPLILVDDLVEAARNRSLQAGWGSVHPENIADEIAFFLAQGIPLIAVQQYRPEEPTTGHYRVIIGIEGDIVTYHDPCPTHGGPSMAATVAEFRDKWRPSGQNVRGGIAIWMAKPNHPPFDLPLAVAGDPHPWLNLQSSIDVERSQETAGSAT